MTAREVSWISTRPGSRGASESQAIDRNPTAEWVAPFVAILGAGMISHAMSAGFEWLYGLRFLAAVIVLWIFRERYKSLDWRIDWTALVAGLLVFVIWITPGNSPAVTAPAQLSAAPPALRTAWLVLRISGAVVTVPIAEELAFRGFLLRRFLSSDFAAVSFRRFSWIAFLGSSILFGLLHGNRWIVGTLAGAIYALSVQRRGRLGNAVVAHAITNTLLAVDVVGFHHWGLW
ncbi:MAG TPA: CAAX prenyl protease-related protein [Candidatus Binataceae bacterium]|nr:CAAX prenyl protease-related protein [Candidatus Binataceae bacterium]